MTFVISLALALALTALVTRRRRPRRRIRRAAKWLWTHPATTGLFVVFGYSWHRAGFNQALVVAVGYTTVVVAGRFWWQRTQGGLTGHQKVTELRARGVRQSGPCALYRLYDADRSLLYIGITVDPARRFAEHADTQPWWSDVSWGWTRVTWFDSVAEARAAETAAIRSELPRWNTVSNHRNPLRWVVPRSAQQGVPTSPPRTTGAT